MKIRYQNSKLLEVTIDESFTTHGMFHESFMWNATVGKPFQERSWAAGIDWQGSWENGEEVVTITEYYLDQYKNTAFIAAGTHIIQEALNNVAGQVLEYTGGPPSVITSKKQTSK